MSLHTRCPQRIACRTARHAVWPRRCARYYVSNTADEPEWFQQVRTELLSRKPRWYHETLDSLDYQQLRTTFEGFQPARSGAKTGPTITSLTSLLTRFNARLPSSTLLSDGTDSLHSPGEPWERRMWAGGAVRINPSFEFGSKEVKKPWKKVTCFERIKDVRLQGTGTEAKVFVTIERSFGHTEGSKGNFKRRLSNSVRGKESQQVGHVDEWGAAILKEERNLVFLRPKTTAELAAVQSGHLLVPRYLKSPNDPDYSYVLTPTRSLLFRYSALTFNAHLLHLDLAYARDVEGHRNLLVHGPLTLTLMLQVLDRYLQQGDVSRTVTSIEYRNLAPLYCNEEMRVCVKKKKSIDKGEIWDVWIEGPTGGMAVKAVANTIQRGTRTQLVDTNLLEVGALSPGAQDKPNSLDEDSSGIKQSSKLSQAKRRKLRKRAQLRKLSTSNPLEQGTAAPSSLEKQTSKNPVVDVPSQQETDAKDGLDATQEQPPSYDNQQSPEDQESKAEPIVARKKTRVQTFAPYSGNWRTWRTGKALRYLYLEPRSPLVCRAEVLRQPEPQPEPAPEPAPSTTPLPPPPSENPSTPSNASPIQDLPTSSLSPTALSPSTARPSLAQRQRAALLAGPAPDEVSHPASSAPSRPLFRRIEAEGSWQPQVRDTDAEPARRTRAKRVVVKKVDQLRVRKVGALGLREVARKRGREGRERKRESGDVVEGVDARGEGGIE